MRYRIVKTTHSKETLSSDMTLEEVGELMTEIARHHDLNVPASKIQGALLLSGQCALNVNNSIYTAEAME